MNEENSLIDRIRAKAVDYSGYYLTRNPFPETGKAPQHPSFCAGRKRVLDRIYDFIADVYSHESISGMVLLGIYGGGKTHILRYVRDKINNELKDISSGGAIAVYIEKPQTGVLHIYSEFMNGIEVDFYTRLVWKVVSSLLKEEIKNNKIAFEQLRTKRPSIQKWIPTKEELSISDIFESLDSVRENIANRNIGKREVESLFQRYLLPYISDKDVLKCSVKLLVEDDLLLLDESWKFICGSRMSRNAQNTLGLSKPVISTRDINKSIFRSIIDICRACGYKAVFLLLDEVEALASLGPQTRFSVLDEFRSFFDSIPSNFGIILTCIARDWHRIVSTLPALRDRIKHVVELGYMEPDEASELVQAYLANARTTKEVPDPLYPFRKDAIFELCKLKNGIVRYIVESCHILLTKGIKQGFPSITRDFVLKYIKPTEVTTLA